MTSGTMELLGVQFERDVIAKLFDGDPSFHMWVRRCSAELHLFYIVVLSLFLHICPSVSTLLCNVIGEINLTLVRRHHCNVCSHSSLSLHRIMNFFRSAKCSCPPPGGRASLSSPTPRN